MPAVFAEVLLRVYTRDVRYVGIALLDAFILNIRCRFFGVIQAGYRQILQTMPVEEEAGPSSVTPPATEAPTTPRPHSRNPSLGILPGTTTRENTPKTGGTPSFSREDNEFMTVSRDHGPTSPTRRSRNKRDRDTSGGRQEAGAGYSKKKKGN